MDIKTKISTDLDIPQGLIEEAISVARAHVKKFKIPKRGSGERVIYQPARKLKTIQYWLMTNIFNKLPVHKSAMAYKNGLSIFDNAIAHRDNKFFLKMDLEDFFPSIHWNDLNSKISEWHKSSNPGWDYDSAAELLIRNACFYRDDKLPIGYPSSPVISNIVMLPIDVAISELVADYRSFGNVVYTRYADDLVFSTDKNGACKSLIPKVADIINKSVSPKLNVNRSKTKAGSSRAGSASVTGLKICSGGHITIHKNQKDHIRLLLSLYKKGALKKEEYESLLGHLSYIRHVSPDFYSKLQKKYFVEITNLKGSL